jgi:hypothetical protein
VEFHGFILSAMPNDDTGWKPIQTELVDTKTQGDEYAKGLVEPATGLEKRPCMACRSFEPPSNKVVEHFIAHGLKIKPNFNVDSPITKDFKGRKNMSMDIRDMGFCRLWVMPVDIVATCERWCQKTRAADFR